MRIVTDIFEFCAKNVPRWNTISVSGYHIREAGSTAVQEVAFTLANGLQYVQAAVERGLDVDSFAPRISFFFNAHNDFHRGGGEVPRRAQAVGDADARAPRRRRTRARSRSASTPRPPARRSPRSSRRTTSSASPTRRWPRSSAAASRCTRTARDEALALPTEESAKIALRTQQVLAHETGVVATADPLAGSYAVESLTLDIEREARALIEKHRRHGRRAWRRSSRASCRTRSASRRTARSARWRRSRRSSSA